MKVLHINASTRGPRSHSLAVAQQLLHTLGKGVSIKIDYFDLFSDELPKFDADAFTGDEATPTEKQAWNTVKAVFDRFAAADLYIINMPLWNNGVPYVVKQFIDVVTQPGWTFVFDQQKGYCGLLKGKKAVVVHASGVYHDQVPTNFGSDFATPYLDNWLRFIGVEDIQHIHVAPTVVNANFVSEKAAALAKADEVARDLVARA
jgi:FMN-dependent NADH-azoreductase